MLDCVSAAISLWLRHENEPFFDRIVTVIEKWFVYDKVQSKRSCKHICECARKVQLSVSWDFMGIISFELLRAGKTTMAKK